MKVQTILRDNGREYCGRPDKHPYELFLQFEEIEQRTTKVGRPSPTGSSSGSTARSSKSIFGSRAARPGTRRLQRCRRTWMLTWRPITARGHTAAAGWTAGRPTRSSRPGSPPSHRPGRSPPERRSRPQRRPDLGEAGCQALTVLVHSAAHAATCDISVPVNTTCTIATRRPDPTRLSCD